MRPSLKRYTDSVSAFDEIECNLLKFSSNPIRNKSSTDVSQLARSIQEQGLLEPIIVRPKDGKFEVVAGNRRLEACKLLRYRKVKCIVAELDDKAAYEVSITENIQRKTLDPIEEALAFKRYCDEFGWGSQSELAHRIGKSQEYISHRIKLLGLPIGTRIAIEKNQLSVTAAQELIWLKDESLQQEAIDEITKDHPNSQTVRKMVRALKQPYKEGNLPDFESQKQYLADVNEDQSRKLISESIMILRITMIRFDRIISRAVDRSLRDRLLNARLIVHGTIDELIRLKEVQCTEARCALKEECMSISSNIDLSS